MEQKRSEAPVQDQSVDTKMLRCSAQLDIVITSQVTLKPTLCQALCCVLCKFILLGILSKVRSIIIIASQTQQLKHREAEYVSQGHTAKTKKQDLTWVASVQGPFVLPTLVTHQFLLIESLA